MGSLSDYIIDTVAFVRYLEDELPPRADKVFRDAESGGSHLLLPQIAMAEFMYLALKGRLKGSRPGIQIREVLHNLSASDAFTISSMPQSAWDVFVDLNIPELHDRMIAAEAISRDLPLVSNDHAFKRRDKLTVVW